MKRWAYIRNGTVVSTFEGADDKAIYADVAQWLMEVGPNVRDNMEHKGGGVYGYPDQPAEPAPTRDQSALTKLATLSDAELDKLVALAKLP